MIPIGQKIIKWNGSKATSGIYLIRSTIEKSKQSEKIILLK
jgi:hypothetical protein